LGEKRSKVKTIPTSMETGRTYNHKMNYQITIKTQVEANTPEEAEIKAFEKIELGKFQTECEEEE
jgi:hypothetical protein